jgi:hypothetical protein
MASGLTHHEKALSWLRSHVGETEHPKGSNTGPFVRSCQAATWLGGTARSALLRLSSSAGTPGGTGVARFGSTLGTVADGLRSLAPHSHRSRDGHACSESDALVVLGGCCQAKRYRDYSSRPDGRGSRSASPRRCDEGSYLVALALLTRCRARGAPPSSFAPERGSCRFRIPCGRHFLSKASRSLFFRLAEEVTQAKPLVSFYVSEATT